MKDTPRVRPTTERIEGAEEMATPVVFINAIDEYVPSHSSMPSSLSLIYSSS
jgi:hypothetical protein